MKIAMKDIEVELINVDAVVVEQLSLISFVCCLLAWGHKFKQTEIYGTSSVVLVVVAGDD